MKGGPVAILLKQGPAGGDVLGSKSGHALVIVGMHGDKKFLATCFLAALVLLPQAAPANPSQQAAVPAPALEQLTEEDSFSTQLDDEILEGDACAISINFSRAESRDAQPSAVCDLPPPINLPDRFDEHTAWYVG
ncbi:MAG: hypothetical protein EBQ89_09325 [Alphaproteobacteria bacterium]|nr:hypothetical protein [Alphaproteobacteria bacterium]